MLTAAFFFLGLAALFLGLRLRARRYAGHFVDDRQRDETPDFTWSDAVIHPLEMAGECLIWPETKGAFDTAFLEIGIECGLLGRLTEPWVEVRTRHLCVRQYFARGSRGKRLVNLSGLIAERVAHGQHFLLSAERLICDMKDARLVLFHTPLPERPRAVIIAPHPDDAEIAAFGFYRHADATVVTLTAGDLGGFYLGHLEPGNLAQAQLTAQLRGWDSVSVPALGGVAPDRAINLGYFDSTLEAMHGEPQQPATLPALAPRTVEACRRGHAASVEASATWTWLVADLTEIFRRQNPEVIVTPHPFIDDHPDHAFATLAVCAALRAAGLKEGQLLLYTNHPPATNLYPVGENDGAVSPPPHSSGTLDFRTLYSHPLSVEDQQLKFLALEAMHDLRTLPTLGPKRFTTVLRSIAAALRDQITGLDDRATSYFRRAVRPNELFFALPFADAERLSQRFSEAYARGDFHWHGFAGPKGGTG